MNDTPKKDKDTTKTTSKTSNIASTSESSTILPDLNNNVEKLATDLDKNLKITKETTQVPPSSTLEATASPSTEKNETKSLVEDKQKPPDSTKNDDHNGDEEEDEEEEECESEEGERDDEGDVEDELDDGESDERRMMSNSANDPGKMFIGGLSGQTTPDNLKKYFEKFGAVTECMIMKDAITKRSR